MLSQKQIEQAAIALIKVALHEANVENGTWTVDPSDAEWCKEEGFPTIGEIEAEFPKVVEEIERHECVSDIEDDGDNMVNINFYTNYIPREYLDTYDEVKVDHNYYEEEKAEDPTNADR